MTLDLDKLPPDVRQTLPPLAQHMFKETLERARLAAESESEAQRLAWEAVRRKYEPRKGYRLWVRKDWRKTAPPRTRRKHSTKSQRRLKEIARHQAERSAPRKSPGSLVSDVSE